MPTNKLPGRSDGRIHPDLRLYHLSVSQILWYARAGDFNKITALRSGSGREADTTTVTLSDGRTHTWRHCGSNFELTTLSGRRGERNTFRVTCPEVPSV